MVLFRYFSIRATVKLKPENVVNCPDLFPKPYDFKRISIHHDGIDVVGRC